MGTVCLPRKQIMCSLAEYAHASCETCPRHFFNVEIMRETSICIVTETEESDVPDKRQHDGIDGEVSVNVAIDGETSATVAAVDNNFEQAAVSADRCSQRIMQSGRSAGQRRLVICMKIVGQLVEYFAGHYNFRVTGPLGKWLKKVYPQ